MIKNKQNGDEFILAINGDSHFITVTYSQNAVARAWHGFSDDCIGKAGGYGYDKESTVLAEACVYFTKDNDYLKCAGVGKESLKRLVSEKGGHLYDRNDMIDFVYQDIAANKY